LTPLRFLMVCMQYPTGPGQSYMTTELADALVSAGHQVEVLFLDWNDATGGNATKEMMSSGVRVVRCAAHELGGLGGIVRAASKFVLSGRRAARAARDHFDLTSFDAAIAWMPASAIARLVRLFRSAGIRHRLLFIWDFFPFHHREIGLIPAGLPFVIARALEQRLLSRFSTIICSMPANGDYLRRHYRIAPDQNVLISPIWSSRRTLPPVDRAAVRARHGLPAEVPIAVFGGQFVEGRGFEQMLDAAEGAMIAGSPLLYLFVGDGRLAPVLKAQASRRGNVRILDPLSRDSYLELLGACDAGMAATVPGVSSFSFPSKIMDYLAARLPVILAVEDGNDMKDLLDRYRVGAVAPFGDALLFQRETHRFATDQGLREAARLGAPRCLDEVFDVRHIVGRLVDACA
jgi:hypothetical protein